MQKLTSVVEFWALLSSHWSPLLINRSCDIMYPSVKHYRLLNTIDLAIDPPSKEAKFILSWVYPVRYCALIGMSEAAAYITQAAFEWGLSTKLVDANRVCQVSKRSELLSGVQLPLRITTCFISGLQPVWEQDHCSHRATLGLVITVTLCLCWE